MFDLATRNKIDLSILEVLQQYDKAWLPPRIARICEPMERLGLLARVGEQWRLTDAGRTLIMTRGATRH